MKKFLAIMLALVMLFALTACSSKKTEEQPAAEAPAAEEAVEETAEAAEEVVEEAAEAVEETAEAAEEAVEEAAEAVEETAEAAEETVEEAIEAVEETAEAAEETVEEAAEEAVEEVAEAVEETAEAPAEEKAAAPTEWPNGIKEVTVLVPQDVGSMLDQSTRIMVDYLNEVCTGTKFVVENDASGSGNKSGMTLSNAEGDGSVVMAHGAGAIVNYYSGTWEKNLADRNEFVSICGNVGQLQPSGGVFLTPADNDKFTDIPSFVEYVKAHPGEVRVAYATGTPHEMRIKLITNYYGISDMISWQPGNSNDVRTWINGGNVELACLTETQGVADIKGGKVIGILDSLIDRNYTDDLKDVLDNVPIVTDYVEDRTVAEGLVCAWPMTIYGPASMTEETAKAINAVCAGIADSPEYMERIKALGSSNTYQIFSFEEINEITKNADDQIKSIFESFNQ